jgi:methionyl-tRNA formyltransferase
MKKNSIAYFGTPYFSAHILERILTELSDQIEVKYVVTQPDMPIGRKQIITPSSVKKMALAHNIPVFHDINVEKLGALDLVLLFAYGEIITSSQLAGPKQGFWNIHLSLLPAFRGATPTVFPIILGHKTTGTTLTKMDSELDHGPIIAQHEREITPSTTNTQLINLLADDSFELFKTVINSYDLSEVPMQPQNHEHATYTRTLNRHDGFIELNFVKSALKNEPDRLYRTELNIRKQFSYPPYSDQLIRYIVSATDIQTAEKLGIELRHELEQKLTISNFFAKIDGPITMSPTIYRGLYRFVLIGKYTGADWQHTLSP